MIVSVIVPTRNRAQNISVCLSDIDVALQKAGLKSSEIIIVDNGSTDGTVAAVNQFSKTSYCKVLIFTESERGAAKARNTGISEARGDIFVFTDDDCRLSKTYFVELIEHFTNDGESDVLRGGRVELGDPADLPITILTGDRKVAWSKAQNSAAHDNPGNALFSCNMAFKRTTLKKIGIFDPNLGVGAAIPAGEDTDYIYRAYLAGVIIQYVPDMTVHHFHGRKTVDEGYALFRNYTIGGGALYAKYFFKYPNFSRQFYWDLKNAISEFIYSNNTFMPKIGFSHRSKIFYSCLGAIKYIWIMVRG